ncbi:MAG: hypothetical protein LBT65_03300 [Synergistaceae bacterium]|nr:hypothetical protein [Synergistaceae bacterium]
MGSDVFYAFNCTFADGVGSPAGAAALRCESGRQDGKADPTRQGASLY